MCLKKVFPYVFVTLLGVLSACSKTVPISGTTATPLVNTLPITVGALYDEGFRQYIFEQDPSDGKKWRIELADFNIEFFDHVFNTMFRQVISLEDSPNRSSAENVQAILQPSIKEFGFLTPEDTGLKAYSVSIKYHVNVLTAKGELIMSWPITGYGKSIARGSSAKTPLNEATRLAIRDAAATIAIDFKKQPPIRDWLKNHGIVTSDLDGTS